MNRTPKKTMIKLLALSAGALMLAAACASSETATGGGSTGTTQPPAEETPTTTAEETPTTTAEETPTTTQPPERETSTQTTSGSEEKETSSGSEFSAALAFDVGGRGDGSFNDAAGAGLDRAAEQLGVQTSEVSPNPDGSNRAEILQISADNGANIVIGVGFLFGETIHTVAQENPNTYFGVVDDAGLGPAFDAPLANLSGLTFAEHEGSFLVGAVAALKTQTNTVGFIGGVDIELIRRFHAGFEAGVKAVDPAISILSEYVTEPPDFDGWAMPAETRVIAQSMYEDGADIIYHAAGGSGAGLFEAAREYSESYDDKVWAIGVDSDQYFTADESVRPYILSSMLKRVDVAVYNTIEAVVNGNFQGNGPTVFDLSVDGVGYSTSGGFIDDIVPQIEEFKLAIVSGEIVVPKETSS